MALFGHKHTFTPLDPAQPDESREGSILREEVVMVNSRQSQLAEQYRRMRNSVQAMNPDGAARSILMTSAIEGEGKTVTTINLAVAMAELAGQRVCIVDANHFSPAVEEFLSMPRRQGLSELLSSKLTMDEALRRTSVERLDIIGAGSNQSELVLNVDRVRSILNTLKRRYDYVLLDAPAVLRANHPSLLASVADGILLVVRMGHTPKQLVEEAFGMLENLGGNLLGTCATDVEGI
jgi:capsular exopolysaccharide synthesis family protein